MQAIGDGIPTMGLYLLSLGCSPAAGGDGSLFSEIYT